MRGYYLKAGRYIDSGCRGGVGGPSYDSDYELEIGHNCNASFEMVAMLVMYDEMMELINNPSPLFANLIRKELERIKEDLLEQHHNSSKDISDAETASS